MMKMDYMKRASIPMGLLFGLLGSQQAFVLETASHSTVGRGILTQGIDAKIQASVTLQAKQYNGSGVLVSPTRKPRADMRPDRAIAEFLSGHHSRHGSLILSAADGSKLGCELDVSRHDIGGHCSDGQQELTIKPDKPD